MTQPGLEERWWDLAHHLAAKLHHKAVGLTVRVSGVTWSLQRVMYYRWARLCEDRVQSEPPVGDVCSDCGWTLTVVKAYDPHQSGLWEAKCKQCDLFVISYSPTMAVDKFRKLLLVRSCGVGGPNEDEGETDG